MFTANVSLIIYRVLWEMISERRIRREANALNAGLKSKGLTIWPVKRCATLTVARYLGWGLIGHGKMVLCSW